MRSNHIILGRIKKIEILIYKQDIKSLPKHGYEHGGLGLGYRQACKLFEGKKKKKLLPCSIDLNLKQPSKENLKRHPNSNLGPTSCFFFLIYFAFLHFFVARFDTIVIPFHIIVVHFHACCCFAFCLLLFLFMCYCFFHAYGFFFTFLIFFASYNFVLGLLLFIFHIVTHFHICRCFCMHVIVAFHVCYFSLGTCFFIVVPLHAYCCCSSI